MDRIRAKSPPPADRYCDIVMKGGITSGIVYPPLVGELAKHYRFKNIGGTSAGAIAAAATAAAEYRRRHDGPQASFNPELGALPEQLGAKLADGKTTKLASLFQPAPECQRLFRVLMISLNAKGTWRRVGKIVFGFLRGYLLATLLTIAIALFVVTLSGWVAGGLALLLSLTVCIGLWVYWDFTRNVAGNSYGMCTGMTVPGSKHEALTPWLHALIQNLAGKPLDQPLTFEDLWHAPGFPPPWLCLPGNLPVRSIDLRMFTTNLSVGRPFILPLSDETCRLFYQPHELRKYLPAEVMEYIETQAEDYQPKSESDPSVEEMRSRNLALRELPGEKWPVVLAARMSLSFPLLFSAIPLWAIDYDAQLGKRSFSRCRFSDGGMCSNFPIHMFDGLLPIWPTFGVLLEPKLRDRRNLIFLPRNYWEGYGERWHRFDDKGSPGSRMGGFLGAIVNAMQNWNDNALSRMPGVRDRVVRLRLRDHEGGLNLNMEPETIRYLAARGAKAARRLVVRFHASGTGWQDQRWIRLRVALDRLEERMQHAGFALNCSDPHAATYDALVQQATGRAQDGEARMLSASEAQALLDALIDCRNFINALTLKLGNSPAYPVMPAIDLKIRPSL